MFRRLKVTNTETLQGIFPDQTSRFVEQQRFRFCHVDVDVRQSVKDVIDWIWDKTTDGKIAVHDDYGFGGCDGIKKRVKERGRKAPQPTCVPPEVMRAGEVASRSHGRPKGGQAGLPPASSDSDPPC